ncbi:MAG: serine/threonine protein kinase [Acidobacteriia bacterium]|nr:serine/threonine protein kinase [Terriglobia bacterium]
MSFELGRTVGGYEFLDVLDTSSMDVAYKVRNHLSQRLEALKVLPANSSDDREGVERFLREIKVHARLLHPNIVTFYNAAELEGQLIMTTEFVEGITLTERVKQMGGLPWCEAFSHVTQILLALGYAHEQGIVHRNVTPDSIILTADATVKLSGFGLAKLMASPSLTQAGAVLGALGYIPPEQIRGVGTLDARSDLYSVGVVLYEALTGRLPFDSQSQFQVMLDHVAAEPPAPSAINPQVPPEFDSIVMTALAKDPAARFQSADQFRARLEGVRNTLRGKTGAPAVSGPSNREVPLETAAPVAARETVADTHLGAEGSPGPVLVPDGGSLVPAFCAVPPVHLGHRSLLILGVSSLAIGMVVAVLMTVARP